MGRRVWRMRRKVDRLRYYYSNLGLHTRGQALPASALLCSFNLLASGILMLRKGISLAVRIFAASNDVSQ